MAEQKLTLTEKFGYGLGDMASNIVYQAVINVLMYFYTTCMASRPPLRAR
jgi:glycoside/pentoside/hexuronide:cation symporter, GPH family